VSVSLWGEVVVMEGARGLTQPLRIMCTSVPHMPQWVTRMSTSVSSQGLGSKGPQTIFPSAAELSTPCQPSNLRLWVAVMAANIQSRL
jgi:hypothetical protein